MDSSPSSGPYWPKYEADSDSETHSPKRDPKLLWCSENTTKLIEVLERDCKELWDVKHPLNRDRPSRMSKLEYLADIFATTAEEISRKIHNLRTQLNNELRKIKKRSADGNGAAGSGSSWEYFEALSFLSRQPTTTGVDPLEGVEGLNIEFAEFQANEEEQFRILMEKHNAANQNQKRALRVAASAPPHLPAAPEILNEDDDYAPRLRPSTNPDECQIFGDFVASELRTLRSFESRKRLKRMIQKAILQVEEEEEEKIKNAKAYS